MLPLSDALNGLTIPISYTAGKHAGRLFPPVPATHGLACLQGLTRRCHPVPAADGQYDVTLVSPRNYFLYTPLLPSSATGAVEPRSIVDPVRRHISDRVSACLGCSSTCTKWRGPLWACRRPGPPAFSRRSALQGHKQLPIGAAQCNGAHAEGGTPGKDCACENRAPSSVLCMLLQGNYFEAAAVDVDHDKRLIRCKFPKEFKGGPEDSTQEFTVPYDVLVFAVSLRPEHAEHLAASLAISDVSQP